MPLQNRDTLKKFFSSGNRPTSGNFTDLIDSFINKADDGFMKMPEKGLMLAPESDGQNNIPTTLLSFFKDIEALKKMEAPEWIMAFNDPKNPGLKFSRYSLTTESSEPQKKDSLFLSDNGNIGIDTLTPQHLLEVKGVAAMEGRIGTAPATTAPIPADGHWHPLLENLDGLQAFEVVAGVSGLKGSGKYALLHAIATSCYGNSKSSISTTSARYGSCRHRLQLRWKGDTHHYSLQIRTRRNYGENIFIRFHLSQLWHEPQH